MDNITNLDPNTFEADPELMERTNPVFNTAKMTLDMLAYTGDKTAAAISEHLGLTHDETMNSATVKATELDLLVNSIVVETRFRVTHELALASGCETIVDLPCGYTPHAVYYTAAGRKFVGLDLPAAVSEAEGAIRSQIPVEKQKDVSFFGVDATNPASLENALTDVIGEVCITTEGLNMYFNESEAAALCSNVSRILRKHGGCWINADMEVGMQHLLTLKAVLGEEMIKKALGTASRRVEEKADLKMPGNSLICGVSGDTEKDTEKARAFLAEYGLTGERMTISEHISSLTSLSKINDEQRRRLTEALSRCAFWKITLTDENIALDTDGVSQKGFEVKAGMAGERLELKLGGRVDSITAPKLLGFFESTYENNKISAVHVDCSELEYISSAGLRVLLIMQKKCSQNVTLKNVLPAVNEILEQTGFDQLLKID